MSASLNLLQTCLDEIRAEAASDRDLLQRYSGDGDEAAFAALVARHAGSLASTPQTRELLKVLEERASGEALRLAAKTARSVP